MSSLIQIDPKVEGKRGQEDVSGSLIGLDENEIKRPKPSSFSEISDLGHESLLSLVLRRERNSKKDLPEDPDKTLLSILWRNANLKKDLPKDPDVCRCGHRRGHDHAPDHLLPRDPRYGCIPGILIPRFLWPFLEEMIAKSDDRTVVASGLSHEINDDTCFLELFKPFGEVISAKLAVRDPEHNRGGLFGFVTFLTKEAAGQAIRTLNGGSDQCIHKVIWAKQINMPPMDPRYRSIPGIFVPPLLWPFVEAMTAKSDDKTVLASNLTLEIDDDTRLLELFKPSGEVIRANLAPIDPERNRAVTSAASLMGCSPEGLMTDYEIDGVDMTKVDFEDNQDCLDLIEKPIGLLSMLDEESNFPRATDLTLANKLRQHLQTNPYFKGDWGRGFSVCHYAGEVYLQCKPWSNMLIYTFLHIFWYGFLLYEANTSQDPLSVSVAVLHQFNIPPEMYQVGFTKLYLRTGQVGALEDKRKLVLQGILGVQKCVFGHQARSHFNKLKNGVTILQSFVRGDIARWKYGVMVKSSITISSENIEEI